MSMSSGWNMNTPSGGARDSRYNMVYNNNMSLLSGGDGSPEMYGTQQQHNRPSTSVSRPQQMAMPSSTCSVGLGRGIKRDSSDVCFDAEVSANRGMGGQGPMGLVPGECSGVDIADDSFTQSQKKTPPPNGKKTKGRVKIKMEYIDNKLRRYTTFSKRKTGIMKKVTSRVGMWNRQPTQLSHLCMLLSNSFYLQSLPIYKYEKSMLFIKNQPMIMAK